MPLRLPISSALPAPDPVWPRLQRRRWRTVATAPGGGGPGTARRASAGRDPELRVLHAPVWRRSGVIGQTLQFSGRPGPVIAGVLAPGFRLYFPPDADEEAAPDIWMANRLGYDAEIATAFPSIRLAACATAFR